jgi:hypothetical protein
VRHLADGTLRRIYDEPLALTAGEQGHFDGCGDCKARFQAIANGARATSTLLEVPGFSPDPPAALARTRARIQREEAARPPRWYERWIAWTMPGLRPLARPTTAVLLAAVLVAGLTITGVAGTLIRVFEPHTLVAVQVSPSDFATSGRLLDYGPLTWLPAPASAVRLSDPTAARQQSGLPILMPASLPKGVVGPVSYGVVSHATGTLTFDAARLRASASTAGVRVSPMPANINGSTLVVSGGPALIEVWGLSAQPSEAQIPTLVIAQTRIPTIDSNGASATQLETYLLSQPGVPPEIAAQIRTIKDPSSTLPIPIPKGFATTSTVQVNGVQGLLVTAALGAGVVWERNGVIYAVGGQLTPDQVLALASSLH